MFSTTLCIQTELSHEDALAHEFRQLELFLFLMSVALPGGDATFHPLALLCGISFSSHLISIPQTYCRLITLPPSVYRSFFCHFPKRIRHSCFLCEVASSSATRFDLSHWTHTCRSIARGMYLICIDSPAANIALSTSGAVGRNPGDVICSRVAVHTRLCLAVHAENTKQVSSCGI